MPVPASRPAFSCNASARQQPSVLLQCQSPPAAQRSPAMPVPASSPAKYVIYQWFMKWFNDRSRLGTEREDIRVLMWHWPFEQNQTLQEDICRTKYHVGGCHLVDNRSLYHQADVVVFHNRKLQTGISRLPLDQPRPTAQKWKPLDSDQLLPTISRCYFYLAFENSVYRDYITEKLWNNALLAGSVPVVLGPPRANYEAFIPKDSFIHVDDFNSIKELADFLNQLASDKERYESYFRWRPLNYGEQCTPCHFNMFV
uniref:Fucosyltransferase n=1 Tax=Paramormyrops kingsleyae TaxID=1676925 RepID=A0A3B3QW46_9TELE